MRINCPCPLKSCCLPFLVLLLFLFTSQLFPQTYLNVKYTDETINSKLLDSIRKITFSQDQLQVNFFCTDAGQVPVNTSSIRTLSFGTAGSNVQLPVELLVFTAESKEDRVFLSWETAQEINSALFVIERMNGGANWNAVGKINASGNSNARNKYAFSDRSPGSGKLAYRLKMTDNDGTFSYSNVVYAEISAPLHFSVEQNYPNPFNPVTTINYRIPKAGKVKITVFDINGSDVKDLIDRVMDQGSYTICWDGRNNNGLPAASGAYILSVVNNGVVLNRKMLLIK